MKSNSIHSFDEQHMLHELKHFLPAQAPLKDFIHHNTLHGFQNLKFDKAIYNASAIFGYRVSLSLAEYRSLYDSGKINQTILEQEIVKRKGEDNLPEWKNKLLTGQFQKESPRIGVLRSNWKREYKIDIDSLVHPILFRILCSYLDQGISMWNFPVLNLGFINSIKELEKNSFSSFFKNKRAKRLLLEGACEIADLLKILVGTDESLYQQYVFDQQFSHQGWSGMVATVEAEPQTLLDRKKITLHDLIIFELLLEIDAVDSQLGKSWKPLDEVIKSKPELLFSEVLVTELDEATSIWQTAFEWSYYDEVLSGLKHTKPDTPKSKKSFQAMFCIDDRECSLRRYLEQEDPLCDTFGTPGFFSVEFYFQPFRGKFFTKLCPAPVTPKFLIKELGGTSKQEKVAHFEKNSHSLFRGWLITQTLGFWSALQLFINIFKPSMGPATASSFKHMDKFSKLTIDNESIDHTENGLQIGFTKQEMAERVGNLLRGIGLLKGFSNLVYVVGHGSSSVNNPHFSAYDCGACSGRAGSVNSRVICHMANDAEVRKLLKATGIDIPVSTQFVGGLHDTTRDEVLFFDEDLLNPENKRLHTRYEETFSKALDLNAKERSRRFESINTTLTPISIHERIRVRSVSLFEPRPELNHATNALCIVGRRSLTRHLFLDRRAFLNSYDYTTDLDGKTLINIMKPLGPVCGGINLEYFFSRVDNQKLGAGTKLPHNVMGLFGVANGIDGDLRPGLPSQMIEVHDPVRLMIIVEHFPEIVLKAIQNQAETYEWFINEWVHLVSINPETQELSIFSNGVFLPYQPITHHVEAVINLLKVLENRVDNLPVYEIS